jgi:hypothetical protein
MMSVGVAAALLVRSDQRLDRARASAGRFEDLARTAVARTLLVRAGLQAYVAAGQATTTWVPRVATDVKELASVVDALRLDAHVVEAGTALIEATAAVTELGNIDRQAREYLESGERLMAADVVFSAGGEAAQTAARLIESARAAEAQSFADVERSERRVQTIALAASSLLVLVTLAYLTFRKDASPRFELSPGEATTPVIADPPIEGDTHTGAPVSILEAAAEIATTISSIATEAGLEHALGRVAALLSARGLVVWLPSAGSLDLHPRLAHGYSPATLARMPPVHPSADNAAAAAYRSGTTRVVSSDNPTGFAAVVAPLHGAQGRLGVLAAELGAGVEASAEIRALAELFAAQLSGAISASLETSQLAGRLVGHR